MIQSECYAMSGHLTTADMSAEMPVPPHRKERGCLPIFAFGKSYYEAGIRLVSEQLTKFIRRGKGLLSHPRSPISGYG